MGAERSFDEILREKLDDALVSETTLGAAFSREQQRTFVSPETHSNTLAFESFFTQLHNTVDAVVTEISFGKTLKKTPYAQAKKAFGEDVSANSSHSKNQFRPKHEARPVRPERTKIRSQLSVVESVALSVLVKFGAVELAGLDIIGETIVKKAYRKLAVELHPDSYKQAANQSSAADKAAAFQSVHEAYMILAKMFKA